MTYLYTVTVSGSDGRTVKISGEVEAEIGNFRAVTDAAMRESFQKLTSGAAVYGRPGEGGCRGPYTIDRLEVERYKP